MSADVWPHIQRMTRSNRRREIAENARVSDQHLLSCFAENIEWAIIPLAADPVFVQYLQRLFQHHGPHIHVPSWRHSGRTDWDAARNSKLIRELTKNPRNRRLDVVSYSATEGLYAFVDRLRHRGVTVDIPEAPASRLREVVDLYGSKPGIRQLVDSQPKLRSLIPLAEGVICTTLSQAKEMADMYFNRHGAAVLKAEKGHAGSGVLILRRDNPEIQRLGLPTYLDLRLQAEPFWRHGRIVVEKMIDLNTRVAGGNPNVEMQVLADGTLEYLYACGMRVSPEGVFGGVVLGPRILPEQVRETLQAFGQKLGAHYSQYGYRGYFDVDTLIDTSGHLFLAESNMRRTGGTHVYHTARALLGADWQRQTIIARNIAPDLVGPHVRDFAAVLQRTTDIQFSRTNGAGVIFTSANLLHERPRKLGYMIVAANESAADTLEQELRDRLR